MDQSEMLGLVTGTLESLGVRYFVTGSVATTAYGESRFTNDIDIVAELTLGVLPMFLGAFPPADFYVSAEAAADAVRGRDQFNIIQPDEGLKVDLIIAKDDDFDRSRLSRARRHSVAPGLEAWFSSPEDVILKKMDFYREGGSEKHLRDITGVLKSGRHPVDTAYVEAWALKLGLTDIWSSILLRMQTKGN